MTATASPAVSNEARLILDTAAARGLRPVVVAGRLDWEGPRGGLTEAFRRAAALHGEELERHARDLEFAQLGDFDRVCDGLVRAVYQAGCGFYLRGGELKLKGEASRLDAGLLKSLSALKPRLLRHLYPPQYAADPGRRVIVEYLFAHGSTVVDVLEVGIWPYQQKPYYPAAGWKYFSLDPDFPVADPDRWRPIWGQFTESGFAYFPGDHP